ncbi:hypothetical protein OQX63_06435 [Pedobacter sp. PF22-3]|uniref:hypothetical protein n=1 Tax=Pedobacter sp. PF22-3 TaxID=2994467 RepID=UPI0022473A53|nr:hypothetical protein [Pedobacter sp. PF22-3]MCX2493102.1 hypothetical protein [Pedobacter sp. PF22-3]
MEPLPSTFVTKLESNYRELWFNNYKYPILNTITSLQEGEPENRKLDFVNIDEAITFFSKLITRPGKDDGVRVYFASPSSDGNVYKDKCGILTLIFVRTTGVNKADDKIYYAFNGKTFETIKEDNARLWVHNYQNVKRNILFETLSDNDRANLIRETKHIWFSLLQVADTIKEMIYQKGKAGNIINGFGIRFVSYSNQDYSFPQPVEGAKERRQRLTIAFSFMNGKKDIGIQDIDSTEFDARLALTMERFLGDTFDTGDPTPPPSSGNKAALDVSDK